MQANANAEALIILFSGYCHTFGKSLYENEENVYYFNLPSTEYNDETEDKITGCGGMGLTMEIYKEIIIIKARNFIKDKFFDGYRYGINF